MPNVRVFLFTTYVKKVQLHSPFSEWFTACVCYLKNIFVSGEDMRKIGPKWGFNSNQGLHAGRRCWRWHRNNSTWNKKFHAESCQNPNGSICKSPLDV